MRTTRPRRRGYALMLVMLEMSLIAALWGIAYRQLAATMRSLTQFSPSSQNPAAPGSSNDACKPLARALSLLETGDPPDGGSGVYSCNATVLLASGPAYFIITYTRTSESSSGETWTVTSTQQQNLDPAQAVAWDTMPPTFANAN